MNVYDINEKWIVSISKNFRYSGIFFIEKFLALPLFQSKGSDELLSEITSERH